MLGKHWFPKQDAVHLSVLNMVIYNGSSQRGILGPRKIVSDNQPQQPKQYGMVHTQYIKKLLPGVSV